MKNKILTVVVCLLTVSAGFPDRAAAQDPVVPIPEAYSSPDASTENGEEPVDKYQTLDELFTLYQPYLMNIAAYKPIYFLIGTQPEKSKFQISLKYRLFNPEGSWSKRWPWFQGFHLAYTQTSFWDLKSDSKPFEDTSYKPEAFFLSSNIDLMRKGRFFLQGGFRHESNGKGGVDSRATDMIYAKPIFIYYSETTSWGIQIAPEVWTFISNESESLVDYRGYFDLEVKVGKADSLVLETHTRWAREGASIQLDLTYPLHRFLFNNINLYFQAQYTNSLAESLIHYTRRTEALRLGFALVR